MQKLRIISLLLTILLLLPTFAACKNQTGDNLITTQQGEKVTTPYDEPDTEVSDSPDGSTKVIYEVSVPNSGDFMGEMEQTLVNGQGTEEITVNPWVGYEFVRWSDGNTSLTRSGDKGEEGKTTILYAIMKPVYLDMPVIHLTTETPSPSPTARRNLPSPTALWKSAAEAIILGPTIKNPTESS